MGPRPKPCCRRSCKPTGRRLERYAAKGNQIQGRMWAEGKRRRRLLDRGAEASVPPTCLRFAGRLGQLYTSLVRHAVERYEQRDVLRIWETQGLHVRKGATAHSAEEEKKSSPTLKNGGREAGFKTRVNAHQFHQDVWTTGDGAAAGVGTTLNQNEGHEGVVSRPRKGTKRGENQWRAIAQRRGRPVPAAEVARGPTNATWNAGGGRIFEGKTPLGNAGSPKV